MARRLRYFIPEIPVHIVQRGVNRSPLFHAVEDFRSYLQFLQQASKAEHCDIHAYVLMTNHVHLLLTPHEESCASRMMKIVDQSYAQLFNRKYGRSGGLYEGRFRASLVQTDRYLITCQRYIELNPVRAGLALDPGAYRWSSYRSNLGQRPNPLVKPHALVSSLSPDQYRALFSAALMPMELDQVRHAINSNQGLGDADFVSRYATLGSDPDGIGV